MVIDEDLLLDAVWEVNEAGKRGRAGNVRDELGKIADGGGYFEVMVVADDLAELVQQLDLKNVTHVGHSTGGGEVIHFCGHHDTSVSLKLF